MSATTPLLELEGISKRYGATLALNDVDFSLHAGEVHALMGENGAGKSTLMKILAGNVQRDTGRIIIDGIDVEIASPADARAHGIAIIHQELRAVPDMSIAENLALGHEPRKRFGVLDRKTMVDDARAKLLRVGVDIDPRTPLRTLSVGMQQMVEIARAIGEEARVLVLDEPSAALSRGEAQHLYRVVREMRAAGVGLVYISHRMEEVWDLADRVTVFRDGARVGTKDRGEIEPSDVVRMMVGRPLDDLYQHEDRSPGEVILHAHNLHGGPVNGVSLDVRAGEVVVLAGLIGSGRTEFARLVFGADRLTQGTVTIRGNALTPRSPQDAIEAGVAMVPESRKDQALFLEHSVLHNISVSSLGTYSRFGVLRRRAIRGQVRNQMEQLRLRTNAINLPVGALSGGNQQKTVLARWLMRDADVLILDEPTRGVDIGAKSEIYALINDIAAQGKAILVISSDLPEAIGICDRLLVMRHGRIVQEFSSHSVTEEDVMAYATGTAKSEGGQYS